MRAEVAGVAPEGEPAPGRGARALVALYPPAWRARYATEFAALLADTGVRGWQVADVIRAAAAAWARPAARLHGRAGRMRATVGVTLCAWAALAAGAVLFGKVTRDCALYLADSAHPAIAWWYDTYALAACASALAMAAGGVPLAAAMLRARQRGRRRCRVAAPLAVPPIAVLGFLGIAYAVTALAPRAARPGATGIGPGWFLVVTAIGLAAAAACAAGPAVALTRARPEGPVLTTAVTAGSCAIALMAVATAASLGYALTRHQAGPYPVPLVAYGACMAVALLVAATSCARGLRAAFAPAGGGGRAL